MALARCPRYFYFRTSVCKKCFSTTLDEEYTPTPQYPPILDLSIEKKKERIKLSEHEEIRKVKTVEEKQIKLNMPKYYGFQTYVFNEDYIPYNALTLYQHISRTHLIECSGLPNFYDNIDLGDISDLKHDIEEALFIELEGQERNFEKDLTQKEQEDIAGNIISKQLTRTILNYFSQNYEHLADVQLDHDPRTESCWVAGGMDPPDSVKRARRSQEWAKHRENEPVDLHLNYIGKPYLTLRSTQPLAPIVSQEEATNVDLKVPYHTFCPKVHWIPHDYKRITNIPGYWPGSEHRFGILQALKRGHHLDRPSDDPAEANEALHCQGILSSFAWLNAQANFLGFTTYNDITYPLVTQTVITNGRLFSFYTYQLNTLLMHSKNTSENVKKNICWASPTFKLYESVENGKITGFNEDVLKTLLKFYVNAPAERKNVDLTPYLSNAEKLAADYEDDDKRKWLEKEFKFITSNRPRQHLSYEVYLWEKIYKIDHKTRFMEARRRPFELRENPWARTYDDRKPKYIPRVLRPDLPRHKGRDAKEYFP